MPARQNRRQRGGVVVRERRRPRRWRREAVHGLHRGVDSAVQRHLAVLGLELLDVVLIQAPVADWELVIGADHACLQVVAPLGKPRLAGGDVQPKARNVGIAGGGVVAVPTAQQVVAAIT